MCKQQIDLGIYLIPTPKKSGEQCSKTFDILDSTGWLLGDPQTGFLSPFDWVIKSP